MNRKPLTLEEFYVFARLIKAGYNRRVIKFYTSKGKTPTVSVEIKGGEEISEEAQEEIKKIYPNSYNHWDDDKEWRRNSLILKH